jgi:hypothetical protein
VSSSRDEGGTVVLSLGVLSVDDVASDFDLNDEDEVRPTEKVGIEGQRT